MKEITAVANMMNYFNYIFVAYMILMGIIVINVVKGFYIRTNAIVPKYKNVQIRDVMINILCGVAMYANLLFVESITSQSTPMIQKWLGVMIGLGFVGLVLVVMHTLIVLSLDMKIRD